MLRLVYSLSSNFIGTFTKNHHPLLYMDKWTCNIDGKGKQINIWFLLLNGFRYGFGPTKTTLQICFCLYFRNNRKQVYCLIKIYLPTFNCSVYIFYHFYHFYVLCGLKSTSQESGRWSNPLWKLTIYRLRVAPTIASAEKWKLFELFIQSIVHR